MINLEEYKYLDLLQNILDRGSIKEDRTGVGTLSIFGTNLRFSLANNTIPMLTTKKIFAKAAIEELLFFLRGETDSKLLEAKGVNIWKGNTSREFLNKRGLDHLSEGNMGKLYGYQWRNFSGVSKNIFTGQKEIKGIDQIAQVIESLKKDPDSRRHLVTAWNPTQLHEMALYPCHTGFQFYVDHGKLSLMWQMRSSDAFLGLPINILSYALLTHLIAQVTNLIPHEIIFSGGDTHLYSNHIQQAKEQLSRTPFEFPKIKINKLVTSLADIEALCFDDFEIIGYRNHPPIKAPMAI